MVTATSSCWGRQVGLGLRPLHGLICLSLAWRATKQRANGCLLSSLPAAIPFKVMAHTRTLVQALGPRWRACPSLCTGATRTWSCMSSRHVAALGGMAAVVTQRGQHQRWEGPAAPLLASPASPLAPATRMTCCRCGLGLWGMGVAGPHMGLCLNASGHGGGHRLHPSPAHLPSALRVLRSACLPSLPSSLPRRLHPCGTTT